MLKDDKHKKAHFDTWEHIHEVRKNIHKIQVLLGDRAIKHDLTKMMDNIECAIFAESTDKLKGLEYGTQEYKDNLVTIEPAIAQHHKANRHHPEFHKDGIDGMNLVDIMEMICDWKAATLRSKDGNIYYSLEVQRERFEISDQLMNIFKNTLPLLED